MPRRSPVSLGFMVTWLVVWTAGMLIMLWALAQAALAGEGKALLLMLVWLAAAGLGLWFGARKLRRLSREGERTGRPGARDQTWDDGVPPPAPPPERR